ncbi:MAG: hypothetical protein IIB17_10955 [Chloroflexi bacterium]|nr:hypothetical protein [Chloroflexota bacterium]
MRRNSSPLPQQLDKPLEEFLGAHMQPSSSRVPPIYRETTKCYAYMCPYAYGCSERTNRPAQVMMRRCMRYMPEELRIKPALSDFALDLLAKQRENGEGLSQQTTAILDEYRPNGPVRKIALEA